VSWYPATVLGSALFVGMWGVFLYQGVTDPLGGINSLWPLFGIANQLLATVALCVGTTVIIKMGKARYAWITLLPLVWLTAVTMSAGWIKIFSADAKLGFLAAAKALARAAAAGTLPPGVKDAATAARMAFNNRLDAAVAAFFMLAVVVILADSIREWLQVLRGDKPAESTEVPFEPMPRGARPPVAASVATSAVGGD
jgi:carbon starvation protein